MAWLPISWTVPQYHVGGEPASGYVLKMYQDGTTTNTNMATDNTGGTTLSSVALDSAGYPSNGGSIFIPHIDQAYKIALYPTQAAADTDTGAVWTVDNLTPADLTDTDTDELAKVSSNDTTAGYLNGKLTGGTGVTLTENSDGGNESLDVALTGDGMLITESADHNNTPAAGSGEFWVRNDTPNTAMFTDDAGNDYVFSFGVTSGRVPDFSGTGSVEGNASSMTYSWSGATCTVTHNLGTTNYAVVATVAITIGGFVDIQSISGNSFNVVTRNTSGTATASQFHFVLMED